MALLLQRNDGICTLTLCSCIGTTDSHNHEDHMEKITWCIADRANVNVAGRLLILQVLKGDDELTDVLTAFEKGWDQETKCWTDNTESKVTYTDKEAKLVWRHVILQKLRENDTWKICEKCEKEYNQNPVEYFGQMIFLPLNQHFCQKHKG